MGRHLKQGNGWRLGWHPEAGDFTALVGGDDWAVELTGAEFEDFKRLLGQLQASLADISDQLMAGETITCDASSDRVWMQVEGFPGAFGLNFILLQGRRAEGGWPPAAASEFIQAIQMETVF